MKLISITPSDRAEKRLKAVFENKGRTKTVHFGLKGGSTYIDHKDKVKREAYIARHKVNENFNAPTTAGSLSRWILWGNSASQSKNIADFKKKYSL